MTRKIALIRQTLNFGKLSNKRVSHSLERRLRSSAKKRISFKPTTRPPSQTRINWEADHMKRIIKRLNIKAIPRPEEPKKHEIQSKVLKKYKHDEDK